MEGREGVIMAIALGIAEEEHVVSQLLEEVGIQLVRVERSLAIEVRAYLFQLVD